MPSGRGAAPHTQLSCCCCKGQSRGPHGVCGCGLQTRRETKRSAGCRAPGNSPRQQKPNNTRFLLLQVLGSRALINRKFWAVAPFCLTIDEADCVAMCKICGLEAHRAGHSTSACQHSATPTSCTHSLPAAIAPHRRKQPGTWQQQSAALRQHAPSSWLHKSNQVKQCRAVAPSKTTSSGQSHPQKTTKQITGQSHPQKNHQVGQSHPGNTTTAGSKPATLLNQHRVGRATPW